MDNERSEPLKDSLTERFEAMEKAAKLSHYKATLGDEIFRFFIPGVGQMNWGRSSPPGVSYFEHLLSLPAALEEMQAGLIQVFGVLEGYLLASPQVFSTLSSLPSATKLSDDHLDIMISPKLRVVRDMEIKGLDALWVDLSGRVKQQ